METYKIAVVGSRSYTNYEEFKFILDKFLNSKEVKEHSNIELVSGGARGADKLVEIYAKENNIPIKVFKADWLKGKSAGFIRNNQIWEYVDIGIGFWDGKSKGTYHSVYLSKKYNKKFYLFNFMEKRFV